MRKVALKMNEELKYLTIKKKLVETDGNKKRAAIKLLKSTVIRSIDRMTCWLQKKKV